MFLFLLFSIFKVLLEHQKRKKSCPRTTDSLSHNMQAVMMWMCSHWLWMRNVYLFRINFAKVFRRIRIFAHKNISTFFLTGWYFLNQILVANKSYNFTSLILHNSIKYLYLLDSKYQLYCNISLHCKCICNHF